MLNPVIREIIFATINHVFPDRFRRQVFNNGQILLRSRLRPQPLTGGAKRMIYSALEYGPTNGGLVG